MSDTRYWFAGSTEEFTPPQLLEQARAAEVAGFDGLGVSDHWAPWFPEGQGSQAWITLSAIGQRTTKPIGTGVTPIVHHYHPGVVAQAFMSLESLYPGRVFLGAGSGESVNETPLGLDWPSVAEQQERFEQGLEAITRLWAGETVTMDAGWFRLKDAKLWTRAPSRPKLYVSAFGPQAAQIAARWGDGLWTLGDPEQAPEVIDAYREACANAGREPGEIILHSGMAWAADRDEAIRGARRWKPTQLPELYTDDIWSQEDMQRRADEQMTDEAFASEGFIVSDDPDEHIHRIREIEGLGATVVCLQLIGQADPLGTIGIYGDTVLPALHGARV
ncbi:MAG: class flavin-dependent oxidoreductase [Solirubrobacterales bacterium]|jgi:coenzyme F420-dependent glucose-6-phosphate dehydrogenase|nr:class flavin-dependent oxidoreductase [Solirubrobacterales bacterium]